MWKTINGLGQPVTWYSEEEYQSIKKDKTEALEQLEFVRTLNAVQEAEIRKLTKTLIEIKEIANKIANYYDGDEYELMRKDAEQILQKISEVVQCNKNS